MESDLLFFDIETRPLPLDQIIDRLPSFEPPANIKDPEKIEARRKDHEAKCISEAALDPMLAEICGVGWAFRKGTVEVAVLEEHTQERSLIEVLIRQIRNMVNNRGKIVGFNIKPFDLPFLFKRCFAHNIRPVTIFNGRFWNDSCIVDLRDYWTFGDRYAKGSLDVVSRFILGKGKDGDGSQFAELLKTDKEKAKEYLANDVQLCRELHPILTIE